MNEVIATLPVMTSAFADAAADLSIFHRPPRKASLSDLFAGSVAGTKTRMLDLAESSSILLERATENVQLSKGTGETVPRFVPQQFNFEEKIFNSLVQLKVTVANYAMHLSPLERHRIFGRLDDLINVDDWHEEDQLPKVESFKSFLKWLVYANSFDWTSIGVSGEGMILAAWSRPRATVTANFAPSNRVTWTARVEPEESGDEPSHIVGSGTPQSFADFARFVLASAPPHASQEHS